MEEHNTNDTVKLLGLVISAALSFLLLPDGGHAVEVLLAAVVANRLSGDPFWLMFVAPPGGAKTELIRALNDVPDIYPLSSLTAKTLVSGYKDTPHSKIDHSLLPKLSGKILALKDFTSVLTMRRDDRAEILGQLREIYDGSYRKDFGTGQSFSWSGKVGLIAGVTEAIEKYQTATQILGERFLLYRLGCADAQQVAQKALDNQGQEEECRQLFRDAVTRFLQHIDTTKEPIIPDSMQEKLAALATLCVTARTGVMRDGKGDIEYIPGPEGPARLAKQLSLFLKALTLVRGKATATAEEYLSVYKLASDTIPRLKYHLLLRLVVADGQFLDTARLAELIGYSDSTTRRRLQDLQGVQLVERMKGQKHMWRLTPDSVHLFCKAYPKAYPDNA